MRVGRLLPNLNSLGFHVCCLNLIPFWLSYIVDVLSQDFALLDLFAKPLPQASASLHHSAVYHSQFIGLLSLIRHLFVSAIRSPVKDTRHTLSFSAFRPCHRLSFPALPGSLSSCILWQAINLKPKHPLPNGNAINATEGLISTPTPQNV
jgi:hypothetical protein